MPATDSKAAYCGSFYDSTGLIRETLYATAEGIAYTSTCARELGLAVLSTWAEVVTMRRTRVRRLVAAGGEA